jgi:hypothetical protein
MAAGNLCALRAVKQVLTDCSGVELEEYLRLSRCNLVVQGLATVLLSKAHLIRFM